MLTHPEHLTDTQRSLRDELTTACPEMIDLSSLITSFAALLRPQDGNSERLDEWITTARTADLPHLPAFTRGLDQRGWHADHHVPGRAHQAPVAGGTDLDLDRDPDVP
jgi:hypothetical protein